MLVCVCCPNPRVTFNLVNAIEIPDGFPMYPAEESSLDVLGEDLEKYGFVYLNDLWYTPDLKPIEGVYVLADKKFR